jgi:cytochrome c biogenesis protein CcdA
MSFIEAIIAAVGLGIWTALQPCPMATNLAAISYLGRRAASPWRTFWAGVLYALGRAIAYVALAGLILGGVLSSWQASTFLQQGMHEILGPLLILVAMVLWELIRVPLPRVAIGAAFQSRLDAWGTWFALPLGVVFALAFCPVSAACFFVSLLAMLAAHDWPRMLPAAYGVGTALPVVAFAMLIALGVRSVGRWFNRLAQIERWTRRAAAAVLMAVGFHLALKYDFGIVPFWDRWL